MHETDIGQQKTSLTDGHHLKVRQKQVFIAFSNALVTHSQKGKNVPTARSLATRILAQWHKEQGNNKAA